MAGTVTEARRAALDVLSRVRRGELADRALSRAAQGLDVRDLAWLRELVYGTLRLRGRLDYLLSAFVRSDIDSLDALVLDVLRLGAYQLVEMDSVPPYAAVSQAVELTRSAGVGRAAGLVNGVLQSFNREWHSVVFPSFEADPVHYLETWGSHPRWLVERWVERWGPEDTLRLVEANNCRPNLYLTPIGLSLPETIGSLADVGITAEPVEYFPGSLRLQAPVDPVQALSAVPAIVQDPAAAAVVRYAGIPAGARVIDVSAAPGGKAIGLAAKTDYVAAADISLGKLRRLRTNVERVGLGARVGLVVADGRDPPFRPVEAVLVDAPCSGTGTLRRHADGRWRLAPADIEALAELQAELLVNSAELVAPGGLLVYATCSLEPEENEEQVERFLARDRRFRRMAPEEPFDGTMLVGDYLTVLPQVHGVDGSFAARLEREL